MDAKLEAEAKENPPLIVRFECKICMIEFTRTIFYDKDKQEYLKFKDIEKQVREIAEDDEKLEKLVFVDICNDCKNK
jgi:ClpP class serine protease